MGDPAPPTERGTAAPTFRSMPVAGRRSPISATAELLSDVVVERSTRRARRMRRNQTRPLTQDAVTPHTPAVHLHTDTPVVHVVTDTPVQLFTGCAVVDVDDDGRQLSSGDVRSVERNPDIETLGELLTDDDSGSPLISVKTTGVIIIIMTLVRFLQLSTALLLLYPLRFNGLFPGQPG